MKKIKVLVTDDSPLMRRVVTKIIASDKRFEHPDFAKDGLEACEMVQKNSYDAITLDIEMPKLNGIETLSRIMQLERPVPVVMLSSLTQKNADTTVKCLELGAIDCIGKPGKILGGSLDELEEELLTKLSQAATVSLATLKTMAKTASLLHRSQEHRAPQSLKAGKGKTKAVLIGISTGGPQALQQLLPTIPEDFPVGVVVAQHMPTGFTKSMADRLNDHCPCEVKEAEEGDIIKPGRIIIGRAGDHILFRKDGPYYVVSLSKEPKARYYPAVDVMFESASKTFKEKVVAVVMTGMGDDGSVGAVSLRKGGCHYIIAQDEASSILYGMPKSIVQKKLADEVASLNDMLSTITKNL